MKRIWSKEKHSSATSTTQVPLEWNSFETVCWAALLGANVIGNTSDTLCLWRLCGCIHFPFLCSDFSIVLQLIPVIVHPAIACLPPLRNAIRPLPWPPVRKGMFSPSSISHCIIFLASTNWWKTRTICYFCKLESSKLKACWISNSASAVIAPVLAFHFSLCCMCKWKGS